MSMDRKTKLALLVAGAVIFGVTIFLCAGAGTFGLLWLRDNKTKLNLTPLDKKEDSKDVVKVEVDPAVDVRFGKWKRGRPFENLFGDRVAHLQTDVTAGAKKANSFDYTVEQYDATGRKLNLSTITFPQLQPGETGEADILVKEVTARVVIRPRK